MVTISIVSTAPKFSCGRLFVTQGILERVPHVEAEEAIIRHMSGDWGKLDEHDRQVNESALRSGGRLMSAYSATGGVRFWIITEADRSATTILLPEEY